PLDAPTSRARIDRPLRRRGWCPVALPERSPGTRRTLVFATRGGSGAYVRRPRPAPRDGEPSAPPPPDAGATRRDGARALRLRHPAVEPGGHGGGVAGVERVPLHELRPGHGSGPSERAPGATER